MAGLGPIKLWLGAKVRKMRIENKSETKLNTHIDRHTRAGAPKIL